MEPKLIRKDIEYQKKTLIIVSVLVACLFIGGSFSLLSSSDETEEVVSFKTGNFNLEAKTEGTLSLEGELPKSYDDGFKNNDITLTLTNTGSLEIGKYEVKLEGDTETTLESSYIRYSVSEDEGKTYFASKLLSETDNIIYTGYSLKTTKILKVKLWIDEAAGEAALKKTYNGKINIELYQNEDTAVQVVKSKLISNYSESNENFLGGVVAVNNDGNLYHEINSETIREYRYSGASVNNYVTFNNELWRIIGVFKDESGEEHVKIVRNEILSGIFPENYKIDDITYNIRITGFSTTHWNEKNDGTNNNNDWATAGLQYWLNTTNDSDNNKGYLSYLKDDAISMIFNAKYYLGSYKNEENVETTKTSYIHERSVLGCEGGVGPEVNNSSVNVEKNSTCRVWAGNQATWTGKIGLLYPSDYGYSTNSQYWDSTLFSNDLVEIKERNWIYKTSYSDYQWFISPSALGPIFNVSIISGSVRFNATVSAAGNVKPTLYLKSNVKITGGTGEKSNPYSLTME